MDSTYKQVSAGISIEAAIRCLARAIVSLEDARRFKESAQVEELLFEAVQLRREVFELSRETGVPAPLEDLPDGAEEDVPF
jgi:hypothetical protein